MQNKTIRILTYVLLGLLVVGVIGFVAYFTNGFKSDFKTFYINVDGKDIMESDGGYKVSKDKPMDVKVKDCAYSPFGFSIDSCVAIRFKSYCSYSISTRETCLGNRLRI